MTFKNKTKGAVILISLLFTGSASAVPGFNTFLLPTPDNNTSVYSTSDTPACQPRDAYGDPLQGLCLFVAGGGPGGTDVYVPIAVQYDEFYSYSAAVLEFLQDNTALLDPLVYGDLAPPGAGQGSEDVVVYTNSPGTKNNKVGPDRDISLEDPAATDVGADQYSYAYWGQDDALQDGTVDNAGGPVPVNDLEAYLKAFDPDNVTPVLLADYSQEGGDSWLLANGAILITDPNRAYSDVLCIQTGVPAGAVDGDCIVDVYALDTLVDGNFDPNAFLTTMTLNFKEVSVLDTDLSILGQGQYDFYLLPVQTDQLLTTGDGREFYLPFNIEDYDDLGYNFVVFSQFGCFGGEGGGNEYPNPDTTDTANPLVGCQNDGPERVFLSGRQIASLPPRFEVPEPAILGLLSIGLLGMGLARRRK